MNNQNIFLFSTDLSTSTEISLIDLLENVIFKVKDSLHKLANSSDFDATLQTAFGQNIDTNLLQESWTAGEFIFPEIEVVNRSQINNANGAFARETNKIYLAQEFLLANINNLDAVSDVVLEEYGHFVDSQLNVVDAPGDEGAIFAALVQGEEISDSELQQLRNEDDSAVAVLDGGNVAIEQDSTATTTRVSIAFDGNETNSASGSVAISSDGRYIVFQSIASNIVQNDTNNQVDIFIYDSHTQITQRLNIPSGGFFQSSMFNWHTDLSVSGNGRYIVFTSYDNTLVQNDTNETGDVFVHDRQTQTTQRVSLASDGSQGERYQVSDNASISANGRYVVFNSTANNLVEDDTNNARDVFVHDRQTGTTERISLTYDGFQANGASASAASQSISADGRYVVFSSSANNLVPNDTNGTSDIFVRDLQTEEYLFSCSSYSWDRKPDH